ncbi:MAPEG family protein [Methylocystis parvus]|uniref:MAPEG family protein n=1 Tax=Methylocystis parvus TaxID=134 RepID=A0A6B8MAM3_9HYPH|nr:MAPEG family protein [Methylocystis parvus]QGM98619.1 MAPEG family protein [Methylocystis parvus]WBK01037.1 MAPEG family protein [Methylocystis parvus OBBP]
MTKAILLPVFLQIALTFLLLFTLGGARVRAVRSGEVAIKDIALGQNAWPEQITKIGRAYQNQLETPVLFYALVALALSMNKVDLLLVAGAWAFVAVRAVHAYVHVTDNRLPRRFQAFAAASIVLTAMWAYFALRVLAS